MKTIPQLKRMISDVDKIHDEPNAKIKDLKRATKLSMLYRSAVQYLETNPREEFILNELARQNLRVDQIKDGYSDWIRANPYDHASMKEPQKAYERSVDLAGVKRKIKFLKFLLSN